MPQPYRRSHSTAFETSLGVGHTTFRCSLTRENKVVTGGIPPGVCIINLRGSNAACERIPTAPPAGGQAFYEGKEDSADHAPDHPDGRPFHAPHRGICSSARCARGEATGGCPHGAAFPSQPAIQPGLTTPGTRARGIAYSHMPSLGGLRHPRKDSLNLGWRNAGFRGFADYMQTPEFESALKNLITMAEKERVAIMCAEAVPWRCHRSLIADALLARGVRVEDIFSLTSTQPHTADAVCARIRDRGDVSGPAFRRAGRAREIKLKIS